MSYGLGYRGSKNKIATKILDELPSAKNFVDLFAGGCAITHCAILSNKYKQFYINDLESITDLFLDGLKGKYANENRWISRLDFFALKDTDPYVKYCWSFGNNGKSYLYSEEIEPFKKTYWELCFSNDPHEKRLLIKELIKQASQQNRMDTNLECLERLERLQSLERLKTLTDNIVSTHDDYTQVLIQPHSVVYCDPPYLNTSQPYQGKKKFDSEKFYNWVFTQQHLRVGDDVKFYISEYAMPEDKFRCVAEFAHTCCSAANTTTKVSERLFEVE